MDNKLKIAVILLAAGGLVLSLLITNNVRNLSNTNATTTPTIVQSNVPYFCREGKSLTVTYTENQVALSLSDGRSIKLPQAISASGTRYAEGDIEFWNKGLDAFIVEKGKNTYDNCTTGSITGDTTLQTFTDGGKLFSFSYPTELLISGGGVGFSDNWLNNATTSGKVLVTLLVPKTIEPNTNFSESKFIVGASDHPEAVVSCLTPPIGNGVAKKETIINGVPFTMITYSDAGAGNFYETTSYRTVKNNQCYALEYTTHSTNIGNYSPSQGIKEFNRIKIQKILDEVVNSFKFL